MSAGQTTKTSGAGEVAKALFAVAIALAVAFLIILITSDEPIKAFRTFLTAPFSSSRTRGVWIDDVAKLTLTGLAFSLVFQARQFALGVQGQAYVGGLFAAIVALSPIGLTPYSIPLGMLAAMAAGCVWGIIPGIAKARFGASEIVSSLMLNYIAIRIVNYVVRAPLAVPVVALGYGYLRQGAQFMGLRTDVPTEILSVVQALIILLVASSFTLPGRNMWRRIFGRNTDTPTQPKPEATS